MQSTLPMDTSDVSIPTAAATGNVSLSTEEEKILAYFDEYDVWTKLNSIVNLIMRERPEDPEFFLLAQLRAWDVSEKVLGQRYAPEAGYHLDHDHGTAAAGGRGAVPAGTTHAGRRTSVSSFGDDSYTAVLSAHTDPNDACNVHATDDLFNPQSQIVERLMMQARCEEEKTRRREQRERDAARMDEQKAKETEMAVKAEVRIRLLELSESMDATKETGQLRKVLDNLKNPQQFDLLQYIVSLGLRTIKSDLPADVLRFYEGRDFPNGDTTPLNHTFRISSVGPVPPGPQCLSIPCPGGRSPTATAYPLQVTNICFQAAYRVVCGHPSVEDRASAASNGDGVGSEGRLAYLMQFRLMVRLCHTWLCVLCHPIHQWQRLIQRAMYVLVGYEGFSITQKVLQTLATALLTEVHSDLPNALRDDEDDVSFCAAAVQASLTALLTESTTALAGVALTTKEKHAARPRNDAKLADALAEYGPVTKSGSCATALADIAALSMTRIQEELVLYRGCLLHSTVLMGLQPVLRALPTASCAEIADHLSLYGFTEPDDLAALFAIVLQCVRPHSFDGQHITRAAAQEASDACLGELQYRSALVTGFVEVITRCQYDSLQGAISDRIIGADNLSCPALSSVIRKAAQPITPKAPCLLDALAARFPQCITSDVHEIVDTLVALMEGAMDPDYAFFRLSMSALMVSHHAELCQCVSIFIQSMEPRSTVLLFARWCLAVMRYYFTRMPLVLRASTADPFDKQLVHLIRNRATQSADTGLFFDAIRNSVTRNGLLYSEHYLAPHHWNYIRLGNAVSDSVLWRTEVLVKVEQLWSQGISSPETVKICSIPLQLVNEMESKLQAEFPATMEMPNYGKEGRSNVLSTCACCANVLAAMLYQLRNPECPWFVVCEVQQRWGRLDEPSRVKIVDTATGTRLKLAGTSSEMHEQLSRQLSEFFSGVMTIHRFCGIITAFLMCGVMPSRIHRFVLSVQAQINRHQDVSAPPYFSFLMQRRMSFMLAHLDYKVASNSTADSGTINEAWEDFLHDPGYIFDCSKAVMKLVPPDQVHGHDVNELREQLRLYPSKFVRPFSTVAPQTEQIELSLWLTLHSKLPDSFLEHMALTFLSTFLFLSDNHIPMEALEYEVLQLIQGVDRIYRDLLFYAEPRLADLERIRDVLLSGVLQPWQPTPSQLQQSPGVDVLAVYPRLARKQVELSDIGVWRSSPLYVNVVQSLSAECPVAEDWVANVALEFLRDQSTVSSGNKIFSLFDCFRQIFARMFVRGATGHAVRLVQVRFFESLRSMHIPFDDALPKQLNIMLSIQMESELDDNDNIIAIHSVVTPMASNGEGAKAMMSMCHARGLRLPALAIFLHLRHYIYLMKNGCQVNSRELGPSAATTAQELWEQLNLGGACDDATRHRAEEALFDCFFHTLHRLSSLHTAAADQDLANASILSGHDDYKVTMALQALCILSSGASSTGMDIIGYYGDFVLMQVHREQKKQGKTILTPSVIFSWSRVVERIASAVYPLIKEFYYPQRQPSEEVLRALPDSYDDLDMAAVFKQVLGRDGGLEPCQMMSPSVANAGIHATGFQSGSGGHHGATTTSVSSMHSSTLARCANMCMYECGDAVTYYDSICRIVYEYIVEEESHRSLGATCRQLSAVLEGTSADLVHACQLLLNCIQHIPEIEALWRRARKQSPTQHSTVNSSPSPINSKVRLSADGLSAPVSAQVTSVYTPKSLASSETSPSIQSRTTYSRAGSTAASRRSYASTYTHLFLLLVHRLIMSYDDRVRMSFERVVSNRNTAADALTRLASSVMNTVSFEKRLPFTAELVMPSQITALSATLIRSLSECIQNVELSSDYVTDNTQKLRGNTTNISLRSTAIGGSVKANTTRGRLLAPHQKRSSRLLRFDSYAPVFFKDEVWEMLYAIVIVPRDLSALSNLLAPTVAAAAAAAATATGAASGSSGIDMNSRTLDSTERTLHGATVQWATAPNVRSSLGSVMRSRLGGRGRSASLRWRQFTSQVLRSQSSVPTTTNAPAGAGRFNAAVELDQLWRNYLRLLASLLRTRMGVESGATHITEADREALATSMQQMAPLPYLDQLRALKRAVPYVQPWQFPLVLHATGLLSEAQMKESTMNPVISQLIVLDALHPDCCAFVRSLLSTLRLRSGPEGAELATTFVRLLYRKLLWQRSGSLYQTMCLTPAEADDLSQAWSRTFPPGTLSSGTAHHNQHHGRDQHPHATESINISTILRYINVSSEAEHEKVVAALAILDGIVCTQLENLFVRNSAPSVICAFLTQLIRSERSTLRSVLTAYWAPLSQTLCAALGSCGATETQQFLMLRVLRGTRITMDLLFRMYERSIFFTHIQAIPFDNVAALITSTKTKRALASTGQPAAVQNELAQLLRIMLTVVTTIQGIFDEGNQLDKTAFHIGGGATEAAAAAGTGTALVTATSTARGSDATIREIIAVMMRSTDSYSQSAEGRQLTYNNGMMLLESIISNSAADSEVAYGGISNSSAEDNLRVFIIYSLLLTQNYKTLFPDSSRAVPSLALLPAQLASSTTSMRVPLPTMDADGTQPRSAGGLALISSRAFMDACIAAVVERVLRSSIFKSHKNRDPKLNNNSDYAGSGGDPTTSASREAVVRKLLGCLFDFIIAGLTTGADDLTPIYLAHLPQLRESVIQIQQREMKAAEAGGSRRTFSYTEFCRVCFVLAQEVKSRSAKQFPGDSRAVTERLIPTLCRSFYGDLWSPGRGASMQSFRDQSRVGSGAHRGDNKPVLSVPIGDPSSNSTGDGVTGRLPTIPTPEVGREKLRAVQGDPHDADDVYSLNSDSLQASSSDGAAQVEAEAEAEARSQVVKERKLRGLLATGFPFVDMRLFGYVWLRILSELGPLCMISTPDFVRIHEERLQVKPDTAFLQLFFLLLHRLAFRCLCVEWLVPEMVAEEVKVWLDECGYTTELENTNMIRELTGSATYALIGIAAQRNKDGPGGIYFQDPQVVEVWTRSLHYVSDAVTASFVKPDDDNSTAAITKWGGSGALRGKQPSSHLLADRISQLPGTSDTTSATSNQQNAHAKAAISFPTHIGIPAAYAAANRSDTNSERAPSYQRSDRSVASGHTSESSRNESTARGSGSSAPPSHGEHSSYDRSETTSIGQANSAFHSKWGDSDKVNRSSGGDDDGNRNHCSAYNYAHSTSQAVTDTNRGAANAMNALGMPNVYTMDEVAAAHTPNRTWTVINNVVYDITKFAREHPGGMNTILKYCAGQDGTEKFFEVHSGNQLALERLEGLRIGVVGQWS